MNRIQDLQAAIRALEEAALAQLEGHRGPWDRWYADHGCRLARVEFPLGGLLNEQIRGFVWAWAMNGAVTTANLTKSDGFNAQGIEGKAVIETDLAVALLVARDLPKHRVAVYIYALECKGGMRVGEKLRVDVLARGERCWATNALEFDTPEEATTFARDLYSRWVPVEKLRIVPVSTPRGERYEPGSDDPELLRELVPLFPLGRVLATPGAIEVIERRGVNAGFLLLRHVTGDWGDLDDQDKAGNDHALYGGTRILSAYGREGDPDQLWVITEADRSSTTIQLPKEY